MNEHVQLKLWNELSQMALDPTTDDIKAWCLANPREGWAVLVELAKKLAGPREIIEKSSKAVRLRRLRYVPAVASSVILDRFRLGRKKKPMECYTAESGITYYENPRDAGIAADEALRKAGFTLVESNE